MSTQTARFAIGQIVQHRLFNYRGAIFDIDPQFAGTDDWYEQVARSRPPKDEPWYHVLVDGASHTTYVAERNLAMDTQPQPIQHPLAGEVLGEYYGGVYRATRKIN